jgi:hypothetical protein
MAPKPQSQTALDETVLDDRELEKILEDRERAKGAASEARGKFTTVDEIARAKITDLGLTDGDAVRVGRFRVTQSRVEARTVNFETQPTSRLKINATDDE